VLNEVTLPYLAKRIFREAENNANGLKVLKEAQDGGRAKGLMRHDYHSAWGLLSPGRRYIAVVGTALPPGRKTRRRGGPETSHSTATINQGGHMPANKIRAFLDTRGVKYVTIRHSPAFTAAEVAASAHVAGRDFAKTVIMWVGGRLAMVVLPASRRIVLHDLREMLESPEARIASESEFRDEFPDCELGAMPPFGNLYGLPVYVAASLAAEPEIAFNAGTHTEVIKMAFADYENLVQPTVVEFITS
jgi:Ala-tRNA(Pro) deacylase